MKRLIIAVGLAVLVFSASAPSQTPAGTKAGTVEQELLNLMQAWMNAEVKADMAFLDPFIAEDCVITDPSGVVWTKAQFLGGLRVRGGLGHIFYA